MRHEAGQCKQSTSVSRLQSTAPGRIISAVTPFLGMARRTDRDVTPKLSKYEEADLYLRLFGLYSSDSLAEAIKWFYTGFDAEDLDGFEKACPPGSKERAHFWRMGNFFDLMGTFMRREYMDRTLLVDFCPDDVRSFWAKAAPLVREMRVRYHDPGLYADLELLNDAIDRKLGEKKRLASKKKG